MNYLHKPYIVKAEGNVRLNQSTYLTSLTYGSIESLNKAEGEWVEKDEIILTVSDGKENLQVKYLDEQIINLEEQKTYLTRYVEGLKKQTLTVKEEENLAYYGKLKYYLDAVEEENKQKLSVIQKITSYKERIQSEVNSEMSEEYQSQLEQLELQRDSQPPSQNIYYQLSSEAGIETNRIQQEILELKKQIDIVTTQNDLYEVKAQESGRIHYLAPVEIGVPLDPNQVFGEIQNDGDIEIESYIPSHDRHKVSLGDEVRIIVHGSNAIQNGSLDGEIQTIDNGVTTSSDGKNSYYVAKINPTTNKKKNIELHHGIPVEVQVVYNKETYLMWMLNLLKFT
ncbi:HlyD family efflux transporter periplasmic adaptor subunit [Erysipelothrix inopinata]